MDHARDPKGSTLEPWGRRRSIYRGPRAPEAGRRPDFSSSVNTILCCTKCHTTDPSVPWPDHCDPSRTPLQGISCYNSEVSLNRDRHNGWTSSYAQGESPGADSHHKRTRDYDSRKPDLRQRPYYTDRINVAGPNARRSSSWALSSQKKEFRWTLIGLRQLRIGRSFHLRATETCKSY